ncbi:MAG: phosphoadenosine phosphosulfate reductase [Oligoflexia bacterium]|nr:MAG: phosphoadenosine phosphosulfate reductase [Oligoflexia bacterium]
MNFEKKRCQAIDLLNKVTANHSPAVFTTSFGAEDMVLMDIIGQNAFDIEIVTLDTGRLHEETYKLMQEVLLYYNLRFKTYCPDSSELEEYINQSGINGFYRSVDQRKACCQIRKINPLKRALRGKKSWITGLRRDQSVERQGVQIQFFDDYYKVDKFSPLAEWTSDDVWEYIRNYRVPYNQLHDQNYPSIGCQPCTRPIQPGDHIRSGRWWWENAVVKECGLHGIGCKK